jgi:hypothetical protein
MKLLGSVFTFLLVFALSPVYCEVLTINEYLNMVIKNNSELKSVQLSINAEEAKLVEIDTNYSYFLNTEINYISNRFSNILNTVRKTNCSTSVDKQFKTGTKISLGLSDFTLNEKHSQMNHISKFLNIQQSLLKDINGKLTKAGIAKSRANIKSTLHLLEYEKQNILFNAKLAYWNLSYSRTVISFRKLSLNRMKKILEWNKKRYDMGLVEKSDLLQSLAAVKLRELNLELANQEENKLNRVFNQFLGISDSKIKFDVERFENKENSFNGISNNDNYIPSKKYMRLDVLAALEKVKAASYNQIYSQKNLGADLILIGKFSLNSFGESINSRCIINGNKPYYSMGLRYILPLDLKLRKTVNDGYEEAKISAQKHAEYMIILENNDWLQLINDWNNAKIKLGLVVEIENIQKLKYKENENLLKNGRSTTYFVLQSEQDLDDAILNVLRGILELIKIYEKIETFYNCNIIQI